MDLTKKEYELLIEEAIEESKITIFIITQEFILSKNSIDRVNNIKKNKFKSVLGSVIEKIENLECLKGIDYYYNIYEDRIYEKGYDNYLLTGEEFNKFLKKLDVSAIASFISRLFRIIIMFVVYFL